MLFQRRTICKHCFAKVLCCSIPIKRSEEKDGTKGRRLRGIPGLARMAWKFVGTVGNGVGTVVGTVGIYIGTVGTVVFYKKKSTLLILFKEKSTVPTVPM